MCKLEGALLPDPRKYTAADWDRIRRESEHNQGLRCWECGEKVSLVEHPSGVKLCGACSKVAPAAEG